MAGLQRGAGKNRASEKLAGSLTSEKRDEYVGAGARRKDGDGGAANQTYVEAI
jgi:hypothetical protein